MCEKKSLKIDAQKYTYMIDDSVILTQIVKVEKIEKACITLSRDHIQN